MAITPDFDSVLARIEKKQLWQFPGGVHPPGEKTLSNASAIASLPLPEQLYVPVKQHSGVEGELLVSEGDHVLKGQPLTEANAAFCVPVHAPTSGTVSAIANHTSAHPSGVPELTITIQPDGNDTWTNLKPLANYQQLEPSVLIEAICDAGISGLGGAGFPTHIKAKSTKPIEFLIINGIECEPYISADDRIMREHAWQIRQGIDVLIHLLAPKQVLVAVEDNKPEALKAMQIACQDSAEIQTIEVPTVYPSGGEKQLIQILTGREVPRKGLPVDIGCAMFNVGTCFAIADAVFSGKPLIERVVTVTGRAIDAPQNVWALLGTPVEHLLSYAGYLPHQQTQQKVIMGGPMMGFTVSSLNTPVVKITNCLLVPASDELPDPAQERACIRCGYCTDACPASLLPQQLYWYSKAKDLEKAEEYNLFDCIECGACAYVCPSEIPLVHYYRKSKAEIRNQRDEKEKSDRAKQRFEARKARLLADKEAREEKHRLAAEQRKKAMETDDGGAKAKIAAALARAKAKKAQAQGEPPAETVTATDNKSKAQAAIERAKAKKAHRQNQAQAVEENKSAEQAVDTAQTTNSNKAAKVAAAIAKAKAKKAQQSQMVDGTQDAPQEKVNNEPDNTSKQTDKSAKVAAAIAKAKAKKAEQAKTASDEKTSKAQTLSPEELKRQKVAAALAKAKAKAKARAAQKPDSKDKT